MRTVVLAVLLAGCGVVVVEPREGVSIATDMIVPQCADLGCDIIDCTICYWCSTRAPGVECRCLFWNEDAEASTVCDPESEPVDPFPRGR